MSARESDAHGYINSAGLYAILKQMVKQAINDYASTDPKQVKTAAIFLTSAGLLTPEGRIDPHGYKLFEARPKRKSPRRAGRRSLKEAP